MKHLYKKSFFYFWLAALFVFCICHLRYSKLINSSLDLNVYDTNFVSAYKDITVILCGFYVLVGIIYLLIDLARLKLNTILVRVHIFLTIAPIFVYFFIEFILKKNFQSFETYSKINSVIVFLTTLVLVAQILFIINLITSSIKNFKNTLYHDF